MNLMHEMRAPNESSSEDKSNSVKNSDTPEWYYPHQGSVIIVQVD